MHHHRNFNVFLSTAIQSLLSAPCVVESIRNRCLCKRACSTLELLALRRAAARLSISRAPGGRNLPDLDTGDVFQPAIRPANFLQGSTRRTELLCRARPVFGLLSGTGIVFTGFVVYSLLSSEPYLATLTRSLSRQPYRYGMSSRFTLKFPVAYGLWPFVFTR